jgi:hypothetical protein
MGGRGSIYDPCTSKVVDQKPTPIAIVKTSGQKSFVFSRIIILANSRSISKNHHTAMRIHTVAVYQSHTNSGIDYSLSTHVEYNYDIRGYLQAQIFFKLLFNLTHKLNSNLRNICKKILVSRFRAFFQNMRQQCRICSQATLPVHR